MFEDERDEWVVVLQGCAKIEVDAEVHKLKKGDTLYSISRDLQIDVGRLMKSNNLTSSNIYIGESLIVK